MSKMKKCHNCGCDLPKDYEKDFCEKCYENYYSDIKECPGITVLIQADENDLINDPPHYTQGEIECIDAIESALSPEEFRGYCKGNIFKYEWRERFKGGESSWKKAEYYIKKGLDSFRKEREAKNFDYQELAKVKEEFAEKKANKDGIKLPKLKEMK